MPRPARREKPYIIVFCEGESEQAYVDFLRKEFGEVASIYRPKATGLFEEAESKFKTGRRQVLKCIFQNTLAKQSYLRILSPRIS